MNNDHGQRNRQHRAATPTGTSASHDVSAHPTKRLLLRQWKDSDRLPFAALNADPLVMRYFPAPLDRAGSDALMARCRDFIDRHGWGLWAVELQQSATFIGFVGLNIPTAALPFSPCIEIGWRLASAYWGRGYATEAASEALRLGFEVFGIDEIVSFTALPNLPSQAVMERLGMQRSAPTFAHPNVAEGHWLREHCLYRIDRVRWQAMMGR